MVISLLYRLPYRLLGIARLVEHMERHLPSEQALTQPSAETSRATSKLRTPKGSKSAKSHSSVNENNAVANGFAPPFVQSCFNGCVVTFN